MKIDFRQSVYGLDGTTFKADGKDMMLSHFCTSALLATFPDEANLAGEEKYKRYDLASRIYEKEADVTIEDIAKLKNLIGKMFAPAAIGPVFDILEGKPSKQKAEGTSDLPF